MALLTNKPLEQSVRFSDLRAREIFSVDRRRRRAVAAQARARWHAVPHEQARRHPDETVLIGDSADRSADVAQRRRAHLPRALRIRLRGSSRQANCAATSRSSTRPPRFPECCMHVDSAGWSGEGAFTQVVVDRLRAIEQVALVKVEDAPATRSEADYNFIANEIFVTFATEERYEPFKIAGMFTSRRRVDREGHDVRRARKAAGGIRRHRPARLRRRRHDSVPPHRAHHPAVSDQGVTSWWSC